MKAVNTIGGLQLSAFVAPAAGLRFLDALWKVPALLDAGPWYVENSVVGRPSSQDPPEDLSRRQALRSAHRRTGGLVQDLSGHTPFRPDWENARIVVLGDVSGNVVPRWHPGSAGTFVPVSAASPAPGEPREEPGSEGHSFTETYSVGVVCPIGIGTTEHAAAAELVNTLLGGCHSSYLVETVRERLGLAYSPSSALHRGPGVAHLWVWLPSRPGSFSGMAEAVSGVLDGLPEIPPDRLDMAKGYLAGKLDRALDEPRALANLLLEWPSGSVDGPGIVEHHLAIADVTVSQTVEVARALLRYRAVHVTGRKRDLGGLQDALRQLAPRGISPTLTNDGG
ncbi:insulinase family protein [Kitasatospora sp. NPDC056531]|uniref:insulinase family protein n=1 Tax=Kitasatospora sp. NPDC056531 TaxID=3345856 RepID=UPI0036758235